MENVTIDQFLARTSTQAPQEEATALKLVLGDIAHACKKIALAIDKGALTGSMGELDAQNIQGERQKQLDVITNDIFLEACQKSGYVAGMASEEMDEPFEIPLASRPQGRFLVLFDPLDGSSNVNVNISVGTIFSILRCPSQNPMPEDFLQPGTQQLCAGYALYGSSTMLVFTTGDGVNGFTLDRDKQEFIFTHARMSIPADTQEFAINMSNQRFWEAPVQHYIEACLQGKEGGLGKDFNMRWVASMVAEVHRILIRGGVFLYPLDSRISNSRSKEKGGKLRLMYEANPMAFIVEQAGGAASTGRARILEIEPERLHQRVPVMLGSSHEIERLSQLHDAGNKTG